MGNACSKPESTKEGAFVAITSGPTTTAAAVDTTSGGAATTGAEAEEEALLVDPAKTIRFNYTNDDEKEHEEEEEKKPDDTFQYTMTVAGGELPSGKEMLDYLKNPDIRAKGAKVEKIIWEIGEGYGPDKHHKEVVATIFPTKKENDTSPLPLPKLKSLVVSGKNANGNRVATLLTAVGEQCLKRIKLSNVWYPLQRVFGLLRDFDNLEELLIENGQFEGSDGKIAFNVISNEEIRILTDTLEVIQLSLFNLDNPCFEDNPIVALEPLYPALILDRANNMPKIDIIHAWQSFRGGEYSLVDLDYQACIEDLLERLKKSEDKRKAWQKQCQDLADLAMKALATKDCRIEMLEEENKRLEEKIKGLAGGGDHDGSNSPVPGPTESQEFPDESGAAAKGAFKGSEQIEPDAARTMITMTPQPVTPPSTPSAANASFASDDASNRFVQTPQNTSIVSEETPTQDPSPADASFSSVETLPRDPSPADASFLSVVSPESNTASNDGPDENMTP